VHPTHPPGVKAQKFNPRAKRNPFGTPAVSSVGKRFAVIPIPEATAAQEGSVDVTVLRNFFDGLRRKVPAVK
jgi:hypothetical protein